MRGETDGIFIRRDAEFRKRVIRGKKKNAWWNVSCTKDIDCLVIFVMRRKMKIAGEMFGNRVVFGIKGLRRYEDELKGASCSGFLADMRHVVEILSELF